MKSKLTAPKPLIPGDTIAIVGPAGQIADLNRFERGVAILAEMGFVPHFPRDLWPGNGYLADSDANRAKEIHHAFADPKISAVIAVRGGYGCLRLLPHLDFEVFRRNPKPLIGFSDITALLDQVANRSELLCFHGPVVTSLCDCTPDALARLHECLIGNWQRSIRPKKLEILRGGPPASGRLTGGNLSTLITLLATPYDNDYQSTILVLEDIGEAAYRVDRMLTQLALSGKLNQVSGIILGDFSSGQDQDELSRTRHKEFIWSRVVELTARHAMPVWGDFPVGHCPDNLTLAIGAICTMDNLKGELCFA